MHRLSLIGETLDAIGLGFCGLTLKATDSDRFVLVSVNRSASVLTGLAMENLVGLPIDESMPSVRAAGLTRVYYEVALTGVARRVEARLPTEPMIGQVFSVTAFPVDEVTVGLAFENVTERVGAAEKIRFQSLLLDAVEQAVVSTTADGIVTYWNPFAERLYGWRAEEAIGRYVGEVVGDSNAAEVVRRVVGGTKVADEVLVVSRDGRRFPVQVTASPLRNAAGEVTGVVGISSDISERIRTDEALRASRNDLEMRVRARTAQLRVVNESLRAIIDSSPIAIVTCDRDARVQSWNRAATRIFGYSEAEVIGRVAPATPDELLPELLEMVRRIANGESRFEPRETMRLRRDGTQIQVRLTLATVNLPGAEVIALIEDVTNEKRMQELAARSERRIAMLRTVTDALQAAADIEQVIPTLRHDLHVIGVDAGVLTLDLDGPAGPESFAWDLELRDVKLPRSRAGEPLPRLTPDAEREFPSSYAVPVVSRHRRRGAALFASRQSGAFDADVARLLELIASGIAVAVENIVLFRNMRTAIARAQELSEEVARVRESERRHLGLELHDQLGQSLTALKLSLEAASRTSAPAAEQLRSAARLVSDIISGVRNVSLALRRPPALGQGLGAELRATFEAFARHTGVEVQFEHALEDELLPESLRLALYRVAQEALTNVARHAGVGRARIRLHASNRSVRLSVEDDGVGFDVGEALEGSTGGLSGIRERTAELNGRVEIISAPDRGTRIEVEFPLQETSS